MTTVRTDRHENSSSFAKTARASAADAEAGRDASLPLSGPKVISTFAKNKRGDFVRVALSEYQGARLADVRQTFVANDGAHIGTKKGVCVGVHLLDTLIEGLCAARTEAYRLGWLRDETSKAA